MDRRLGFGGSHPRANTALIPYLPFSGARPLACWSPVVALTLLGFLTANIVGRTLVAGRDRLSAARRSFVTSMARSSSCSRRCCPARASPSTRQRSWNFYPTRASGCIRLSIATETKGEIRQRIGQEGEEWVTVFLPPSPCRPPAWQVLFVKRSELIELDMTIEEAAKVVLSAGSGDA